MNEKQNAVIANLLRKVSAIYNRRKQTDGAEICNLATVIQHTLFGQIMIA